MKGGGESAAGRWAVLFVRKVGCYVRLLEDRWGLCVAVLAAPFTHG